eukprot:357881-Chlamydomonas_euryale.AAC.3
MNVEPRTNPPGTVPHSDDRRIVPTHVSKRNEQVKTRECQPSVPRSNQLVCGVQPAAAAGDVALHQRKEERHARQEGSNARERHARQEGSNAGERHVRQEGSNARETCAARGFECRRETRAARGFECKRERHARQEYSNAGERYARQEGSNVLFEDMYCEAHGESVGSNRAACVWVLKRTRDAQERGQRCEEEAHQDG